MSRSSILLAATSALAVFLPGCSDPAHTDVTAPAAQRLYGAAQKVGNGTVRTYIVLGADGVTPTEVGVAMTESAMDGLPAPSAMKGDMSSMKDMPAGAHAMADMNMYILDLPAQNPTPYKFVQFDWNPAGHEPAGVYDKPHFDFHFYTVSRAFRDGILPTDGSYAAKAASFPAADFRAPFYVDAATAGNAPAAAAAVPQMGLHWLDVRSPELQGLTGHPEAYKPFTTTFIYGSWDGQFIFDEPMITRAHIVAKHDATDPAVRDEVIPVSTPTRQSAAGYHPKAYRITWDAAAKEYRVALTQLTKWN
ncbi:MAG: DUF5602 domain-containing protein [Gemmatirosa sp.]|nr:DUF5602 domain-containing protein [Gemmatirosa sp.]